jgi:hypothetical protein
MYLEDALELARQLRDNWKRWNDLDRGAVIVRFIVNRKLNPIKATST